MAKPTIKEGEKLNLKVENISTCAIGMGSFEGLWECVFEQFQS